MSPEQREKFLNRPAMRPPDGVEPNFENPDNLSQVGVAAVQLVISTLVVGMRLFVKTRIVRKLLPEDYFLLVSWLVFAIPFQYYVFKIEALPLGAHQWDVTIRQAIKTSYYFHIVTAVYAAVMVPLKIAIILQILRIFVPWQQLDSRSPRRRGMLFWTLHVFLALNICFYGGLIIFQGVACQPIQKAWDITIEGGRCADRLLMHIVSASVNTASDLILILLPQPAIWRLNMRKKKKLGLSAVFLLGVLACICSTVRVYYSVLLHRAEDKTYHAGLMGKWADPELTFGFLAACLPVMPTFIKHILRDTSLGRRFSTLWSGSFSGQSHGHHDSGIGSQGRNKKITKEVVTDIEFVQLTHEESRNNEEFRTGYNGGRYGGRRSFEQGLVLPR